MLRVYHESPLERGRTNFTVGKFVRGVLYSFTQAT